MSTPIIPDALDYQLRDAIKQAALERLWLDGEAHLVLLDEGQQGWVERFLMTPPLSSSVWLVGRQRGKTHAALFLAILVALSKKGAIVKYCGRTKLSSSEIVLPTWHKLIETLPEELRPVSDASELEWTFPSTGSVFIIFGTDAGSFDKGRGVQSGLLLLDECGTFQDLLGVESALIPTLQVPGGRLLYLSTPPESLAHPYAERIKGAQRNGRYEFGTFYDNPRINHQELIQQNAERTGKSIEAYMNSTDFRREYLAELVQEESSAGFPSFTLEKSEELLIDLSAYENNEYLMPKYFDGYTSMDLGINHDPHAAVFAIHDWQLDKLIILDELLMPSNVTTLRMFADEVRIKEKILYGENLWRGTIAGAQEWLREFGSLPSYIKQEYKETLPVQPLLRVADDAQGAAKELSLEHKLQTLPFQKHDKKLAVDRLNVMLLKGDILIHPRCEGVISHLSSATWDNNKKKWIHMNGHHFDLVDCIVGMIRHWRRQRKNKIPKEYSPQFKPQHIIDKEERLNRQNSILKLVRDGATDSRNVVPSRAQNMYTNRISPFRKSR